MSIYEARRRRGRDSANLRGGSQSRRTAWQVKSGIADAEPYFIEYYEVASRAKGVPLAAAVRTAVEQLVKLYEAWGKPDKAAEWREKLK